MTEFLRHLPPLSSLRGFITAARLESISRASEELYLSQAAVSRQIRKLEEDLNAKLFIRDRYSVRLTECGRQLYEIANPLLLELANTSGQIRRQGHINSVFVIFSDLSITSWLLMPLMKDMHVKWPGNEFRLISSDGGVKSYDGTISIGLQSMHRDTSEFEVTTLCDDDVFPVCSPNYSANASSVRTPSFLADSTLLHHQQIGSPWPSWQEYCSTTGQIYPDQNQEIFFTSYAALLDAVTRGHGIALVWRRRVEEYLRTGKLIKLGTTSMHWPHGVCAYVPNKKPRHQLVDEFVTWLHHQIASSDSS